MLCHVEVSPFRPAQRTFNVVHAKHRVQTFEKKVEPPVKAIGTPAASGQQVDESSKKKVKSADGAAVGVGAKVDEAFASFMTSTMCLETETVCSMLWVIC